MQKEDPIREVQPSLQGCNAVDTHDPQVDVLACAVPSYGSFQLPLRVDCNILDGGGLDSSADWLVARVSEDLFLQLRRKFQSWALEWRVVDRLRKHVAAKCSDCLFTKAEIHLLEAGLVEFLNSRSHLLVVLSHINLSCCQLGELWQSLFRTLTDLYPMF